MKFLGIDFGWTRNASGMACLELAGDGLRLQALDCRLEINRVLEWIDAQVGGGPAVIAVDAPLVIPNASGMREADRLTHVLYGRQHAGCYPANLGIPFAARTVAFSQALSDRGFSHGTTVTPRFPSRMQIEVFPHIASIELFRLPRILKYKKGTVHERRRGLTHLRELLLNELPHADPSLRDFNLPDIPHGGSALKRTEDQLDSVICAYTAAHWWWWGNTKNRLLGNALIGYIINPWLTRPG